MRPRRPPSALAPLLLALALAGCAEYGRAQDARGGVVRLTLDEYRIAPDHVRVPAGRVTIIAVDRGRLTHNVAIESPHREPGQPPHQYARTATVHPGQTTPPLTVTLRPGRYRLACTIGNHDDLGQYGELDVTAR
jgi:hypothetical protein